MPFVVPIDVARDEYPEYTFIRALTPSEQKAAFHVRDSGGQDLCLKIVCPNYDSDRLDREIRALQSIAHPNVVRFIEYTCSLTPNRQRHYMIEEYVHGADLSDHLTPDHPWARSEVACFFAALCDGLAELQKLNLVHRDLKPSNIRVRPDKQPVIIDFGVARHLSLPDLTNPSQGAAIGTPMYFAPEQFRGTRSDIDHRTDLFTVGVLMYEALVGRHPFYDGAMTLPHLSAAVCESQAFLDCPMFGSLATEWRLVVSKLLEKERGRRPQSAAQVAALLRKIGGI